jgi:hypothetical protein
MEKGFIIFNADGSKPKHTLAAIEFDGGVQTIIDMRGGDVPMLFGCIANALVNEGGVNKELLHYIIDTAPEKGDEWASYCGAMRHLAGKIADRVGEVEDLEDFKEKLGKLLDIIKEDDE